MARHDRVTPTTLPKWFKVPIPQGDEVGRLRGILASRGLNTVCEEARCPNMGECWDGGTATFMVLGDTCTRGCRFCNVKTSAKGTPVDADEPHKVAEAAVAMGLNYVVLTMVDRDDLPDGGARHVADTIREIKRRQPDMLVETLTGDFGGDREQIATVLDGGPDVFAHNVETVERLTRRVRDQRCDYTLSLQVLRNAKEIQPEVVTKSSIMIGLGESEREIDTVLDDLRAHQVEVVTLGQYLRPSLLHLPVKEYVTPARFAALEQRSLRKGFLYVASGPLVRSSYKAAEFYIDGMLRRRRQPATPQPATAPRAAPIDAAATGPERS